MFKTFKTILAFAVSFSIVSISNSFADGHAGAIKKWIRLKKKQQKLRLF